MQENKQHLLSNGNSINVQYDFLFFLNFFIIIIFKNNNKIIIIIMIRQYRILQYRK